MRLTKLQRYTIYCVLLSEKNDRLFGGICSLWGKLFEDASWMKLRYILPELHKKRTRGKRFDEYWFGTHEERIAALQQCINETHP